MRLLFVVLLLAACADESGWDFTYVPAPGSKHKNTEAEDWSQCMQRSHNDAAQTDACMLSRGYEKQKTGS